MNLCYHKLAGTTIVEKNEKHTLYIDKMSKREQRITCMVYLAMDLLIEAKNSYNFLLNSF